MTNYENKMKSMLNYYQIDIGGVKDEKMTKRNQKKFLDNLNANYDAHTINDLLSKIKDKIRDNKPKDEESDDPFFDKLKEGSESDFSNLNDTFPKDMNMPPKGFGSGGIDDGILPFGMNPDIENFINWLSDLLYSADHAVTITEKGDVTNIKLEKLKKKRGGRKK
jgi:hypothetical protein